MSRRHLYACQPVAGYPSKQAAVEGLYDQGKTQAEIARIIGSKPKTVARMIYQARVENPAFLERHPIVCTSAGRHVPKPKPPRGYTEKYVDDARVEINSPDTPLSVKWELLYMLGIARDPAAKGVRE